MTLEELRIEANKHGCVLVNEKRIHSHHIRQTVFDEALYGIDDLEKHFDFIKRQMAREIGVSLLPLMTIKQHTEKDECFRNRHTITMSIDVIGPKI